MPCWQHCSLNLPELPDPVALDVTLPYPARKIKLIDQTTGETVQTLNHINTPRGARFVYSLPAGESLLLCAENLHDESEKMDLSDKWHVEIKQNVLTLDQTYCLVDGCELSDGQLNTLTIFNRLLALEKDVNVVLDYGFDIDNAFDIASGNLQMALELADDCEYYLNDNLLDISVTGFFLDRAIQCIQLPLEFVKHGKNIFRIKQKFTQSAAIRQALRNGRIFEGEANKLYFDSEVESIYLLGNFAVYFPEVKNNDERGCRILSGESVIMPITGTVSSGELVRCGFPFFSGTLNLVKNVELTGSMAKHFTTLDLGYFLANSVTVTINGKKFKPVFAAPYIIDISGSLKSGNNRIEIKITTSCRNSLGPLHSATVNPVAVGPESFLLENDILNRQTLPFMQEYGVLEFGCEKVVLY